MRRFNRRGFIKSSLLASAGATVSSRFYTKSLCPTEEENVIIKRQLGKTDIELPIVSFGVMRADNPFLIKAALEMGYVHFDTAHGYQEGKNEIMLGELFKAYPRSKFILATKVHPVDWGTWQTGEVSPGVTKGNIFKDFEVSLKRLQVKYVDILYLHGVSTRVLALAPQMLDAFSELKKQGKARYIGISTHQNEPDMIQAAIDSNIWDIVLTAINFKHSKADLIKEKIALAAQKGIGIIAMKTMAGGFMDKERQRPINCSAALKWVLKDKNVHTSIPGIASYDMMTQNFSVMKNLDFTEEEKKNIEEATLVAGLYCDGCNMCIHTCKKHLPVNEYMRAFMYAYGYQHFENAYRLLDSFKSTLNPCQDCTFCTASCPKGFQIAERIEEVTKLANIPRSLLI
jgi:predicted aldo/keto reductase-like oxidoreductase